MFCDYIECIIVEVTANKSKFYDWVHYRLPNSNITEFQNKLSELFDINKISRSKIVMWVGDFNLDLQKHESHKPTKDFLDWFLSN